MIDSKQKKTTTISVIMGVYNGEKFLRLAIDSILKQTFSDLEFIVIDDASTDETSEILKSYNDTRLIIVTNPENIGLTKSLNNALQIACGKYIARQDSDDMSMPTRLARQIEFMEQNPDIGLLGTWAVFFDENNRPIDDWLLPNQDIELRRNLQFGNVFCHGSVLIRRSALEKSGYYREKFRYTQDYELWLRLSEVSQIANIKEKLYHMYRGKGTISRRKLNQQLEYQLAAWELAKERRETGKDQYDSLKGEEPSAWLQENYPSSLPFLTILKQNAYNYYIKETLMFDDYVGALFFRWQLFKQSSDIGASFLFIRDVNIILSKLITWQYRRHISWRLKFIK